MQKIGFFRPLVPYSLRTDYAKCSLCIFISDRTGITAENLGDALLEQFAEMQFKRTTCPFIDTPEKAHKLVAEINAVAEKQPHPPILFMSVVNEEIREILKASKGVLLNFLIPF
ncbi:PEP synthetase regulatory protein [Actinobacillus equuli]|nr:PEP synthetase regulatory protein [Actinobacillus equuli]